MKTMKDWTGNKKSAFTTIGAAGHANHARQSEDYYATEPKATELLCELEKFSHDVWEPACGEGHMVKVLQSKGYNVRASDLIDRGGGTRYMIFLIWEMLSGTEILSPTLHTDMPKSLLKRLWALSLKGIRSLCFSNLLFLKARQEERCLELSLLRLCMYQAVGLNVPGTEILRNLTKVQQPMLGFSGRRDLKIKR